MRFFDSLRESWEKLSDRERRLLGMSGGVFLLMLVFVAVWTTSSAVAEVEEERDGIRKVLTDIDLAGDLLEKRMAERKAVEARFQTKMPALAAFVESKARAEGLEVRQVLEEPQKDVNGYRRHGARVSFQGVSLRPVMHLLAAIADEPAPIAVDDVTIQHYQAGDTYKVDIGVVGFEPPKKKIVTGGGTSDTGSEAKDGEKSE
jgi:type II secretory pathway component PulM